MAVLQLSWSELAVFWPMASSYVGLSRAVRLMNVKLTPTPPQLYIMTIKFERELIVLLHKHWKEVTP